MTVLSISFSDKLKIMKLLSTQEGKEKFKEMLVLKMKSQKLQEATAICIAEGLRDTKNILSVEISAGENEFLPLKVTAEADGEIFSVSCVKPDGADFDYIAICEEFNALVAEYDAEKSEFLKKTAVLLEETVVQKGIAVDEFSVKIR